MKKLCILFTNIGRYKFIPMVLASIAVLFSIVGNYFNMIWFRRISFLFLLLTCYSAYKVTQWHHEKKDAAQREDKTN